MGVVAHTRPPSFSGVIFAPIEFSHWRQRQADFSETINRTQMRPRYMWSAVSACSESRDSILKFGRGHFRHDVISGSIGCRQRDRDILVQRHEFAYNHVTKLT